MMRLIYFHSINVNPIVIFFRYLKHFNYGMWQAEQSWTEW